MTLVIDLTPEEEARLQAAARSLGVDPVECARRVLAEHLPPVQPGAATLALFAAWEAEDATDDPEELAARQREWDELKADMNASRAATGEGLLYP
jgi:hypothetical protein